MEKAKLYRRLRQLKKKRPEREKKMLEDYQEVEIWLKNEEEERKRVAEEAATKEEEERKRNKEADMKKRQDESEGLRLTGSKKYRQTTDQMDT